MKTSKIKQVVVGVTVVSCTLLLYVSPRTQVNLSTVELSSLRGGAFCNNTEWWCEADGTYGCSYVTGYECPNASPANCPYNSFADPCVNVPNQTCNSDACACPVDYFCLDACDSTGCIIAPINCAMRNYGKCYWNGSVCARDPLQTHQEGCGTRNAC